MTTLYLIWDTIPGKTVCIPRYQGSWSLHGTHLGPMLAPWTLPSGLKWKTDLYHGKSYTDNRTSLYWIVCQLAWTFYCAMASAVWNELLYCDTIHVYIYIYMRAAQRKGTLIVTSVFSEMTSQRVAHIPAQFTRRDHVVFKQVANPGVSLCLTS